jgi:hypothetical protein
MKHKICKKHVDEIALLRATMMSAIVEVGGEIQSGVALAALVELTVDVAILLSHRNKSQAMHTISEMINLLMLRKHK